MQSQNDADTTRLDYWLNWRFGLCAIWVLTPAFVALFIIFKYEDYSVKQRRQYDENDDDDDERRPDLCVDDTWRPWLSQIHPGWLLGFRVLAFCFLLSSTIVRFLAHGWSILYYYTQWTFTLLTIYFGLGTMLSVYGCYKPSKQQSMKITTDKAGTDPENIYYLPLKDGDNTGESKIRTFSCPREVSKPLEAIVCMFQVIFQTSGGAVMLTDCIYWGVIFPFLALQDYELNFMTVNLHLSNLILLLCDTSLNSLRFPLFRMSYFILWTASFVVFQWIIHACISIRWPYPFLDLSSPTAPIWYLAVALMHLPCYGFFALVVKMKQKLVPK